MSNSQIQISKLAHGGKEVLGSGKPLDIDY